MSNNEINVLIILVLKFSSELPIFACVTLPLDDLVILVEISLRPFPCFEVPHGYILHNSKI
jgi:hypothetical protein